MIPSRPAALALVALAAAACARTDTPGATAPDARPLTALTATTDPVVVAAGDLVCGTGTPAGAPCRHAEVAALVPGIGPAAALLLGDIQYESATYADFTSRFDPVWGPYRDLVYPAPGNHEYQTSGAAGYFDYFNGVGAQTGRAGDRSRGYYSYNLGAWHLIALNSNCSIVSCAAGSAQEQWLRADLAASQTSCVLAYWHHPRYSSGSHGNNTSVQPLWQALADAGADLVLAGHDHDYERFAPMNGAGALDNARGIRSFVVGTGGKEKTGFGTVRANSQVRNSSSFGLLRLTLRATGYDWQFMPIPGETNQDSGSSECSAPAAPPPPPPAGTELTIPAGADAYGFKDRATTNYGKATTLLVDASPAARTYLRFNVTGIGTKTVVSAKLRLYAVDPSDQGGRLHRVASTTWGETSLTWNNAPAWDAAVLGSIGGVTSGSWYEVDVTGTVRADGLVSFALESPSTNGADYRSREGGSATAPRLVIVVQ